MVEHNPFLLSHCDFIVDFGNKRVPLVKKLQCVNAKKFSFDSKTSESSHRQFTSNIRNKHGIQFIDDKREADVFFNAAKNDFYGGLLKNISRKATWLYNSFENTQIRPIIAFDFTRGAIFSKYTSLFSIADIGVQITAALSKDNTEFKQFDYNDKNNHCKACSGTGYFESYHFEDCIANPNLGLWNGLLPDEIMKALKNYNFSKIKGMFRNIKKLNGMDLEKNYSSMSPEEKKALVFGLWNHSFHDAKKQTYYTWRGLVFLVRKYLRGKNTIYNERIKNSKEMIVCPNCSGNILFHSRPLLHNGVDIRTIRNKSIHEVLQLFPKLKSLQDITKILPKDYKLADDVSNLPRATQTQLKLIEIANISLFGFTVVFRGIDTSDPTINFALDSIGQNNAVVVCGRRQSAGTGTPIWTKLNQFGFNENTTIWEALSLIDPDKELRSIRKTSLCIACNGKGEFATEGIDDGIAKFDEQCSLCGGTGIDTSNLPKGITSDYVQFLMSGSVQNFAKPNEFTTLINAIPIRSTLGELNSEELSSITDAIGDVQKSKTIKPQRKK